MSATFYKITERLKVRSFQNIDSNDFLLLLTNPLVNIFLGGSRFLSTPHLVKQFLKQMSLDHSESNPWLLYSIFKKDDDRFIGSCGLKTEPENRGGELFYIFFPEFWGEGFAVEALRSIMKHVFDQYNLKNIFAYILPENIRAQRVAEKLGFKYFKMVNLSRYKRKEKVQQWILFPI